MTESAIRIILAVLWDLDQRHPEQKLVSKIYTIKWKEKGWEQLAEHYKKLIVDELNKEVNQDESK